MKKDIVIFVNAVRPTTFEALQRHKNATGETFTPIVLVDERIQSSIEERNAQIDHLRAITRISADFDSAASIRQALAPYLDRIFAVTSQYENSVHELKKLIPHLPYLTLPTETSLDWATEKYLMRQMLEAYDASLVPGYMRVGAVTPGVIRHIERRLAYPVIVKPSGLEGSLLVSLANNTEELTAALTHTATEMKHAYAKWIKRQEPVMLVEEFMAGKMYSVDVYVSAGGDCRFAPPVQVITGRNIGFDDFFGYMQFTPTDLSDADVQAANLASEQACKALGLRSVTAHVELMKTPGGWKIIELGPRIGGYRQEIYSLGYGMNHIVNDILNRGGRQPIIPDQPVAHTAFLNVYAQEEGLLAGVSGLETVKALPSFRSVTQLYNVGDTVAFAKNNGDPVFKLLLSHPDKLQFAADVRAVEEHLKFNVRVLQYAG